MPDEAMLPAIKAAIRANEIGSASPYQLSFAGKGTSGGSYGVFQNDTYANRKALTTLTQILNGAGLPADQLQRITGLLGRPCPANPLSAADFAAVNAALAAPDGQAQVDALDGTQLQIVIGYLDQAVAASAAPVEGKAQLAICLWCNMTGAPTTLMKWLGGASVPQAGGTVAPPGSPATYADMTRYLTSTKFFIENSRNWQHFEDSVSAGAALLPS